MSKVTGRRLRAINSFLDNQLAEQNNNFELLTTEAEIEMMEGELFQQFEKNKKNVFIKENFESEGSYLFAPKFSASQIYKINNQHENSRSRSRGSRSMNRKRSRSQNRKIQKIKIEPKMSLTSCFSTYNGGRSSMIKMTPSSFLAQKQTNVIEKLRNRKKSKKEKSTKKNSKRNSERNSYCKRNTEKVYRRKKVNRKNIRKVRSLSTKLQKISSQIRSSSNPRNKSKSLKNCTREILNKLKEASKHQQEISQSQKDELRSLRKERKDLELEVRKMKIFWERSIKLKEDYDTLFTAFEESEKLRKQQRKLLALLEKQKRKLKIKNGLMV